MAVISYNIPQYRLKKYFFKKSFDYQFAYAQKLDKPQKYNFAKFGLETITL